MRRLAIGIVLLSGLVWGQVPAPIAIKAKAGKVAVLTSKATGEVAWVWDRRYLPEDQTYQDKAQKTLVVTSGHATTFLVTAVEHVPSKGFTQTEYLVTFEGGPTPPPGPDPPTPPPDTLESRMRAAYDADLKAGKVKEADMRLAGEILKAADQFFGVLPTTGTLYQVLDLGLSTAVPGGMPQVKGVIDAHLAKVHPRGKDVPLTEALKAGFRVAFGELTKAVEACLSPRPPPGPDVIVPGVRSVLLVHETSERTPAMRQTIIALRAGPHADYLKVKGHSLLILDDDVVGPDGQPAPQLAKYRPHYQGLKLPALVILDSAGTLKHAAPLPADETADAIMDLIKKAGG